jgi:butyryl-CoA dehydrogenase
MSKIVNRRDLDFLLYDVCGLDTILGAERFADHDRASVAACLDLAESIAEERFLTCAARLDAEEPRWDGFDVAIIPEVAAALSAYRDAGFFGAGFDAAEGGLQLPTMVCGAIGGIFAAANVSVANYAMLTIAAANLLKAFGSDALRAVYLPPMIAGRWFGTMCLSEPQAGSSLSDIACRAELLPDGSYAVRGSKMWISGGAHALSENIVHMVLARIAGSSPGAKGLSLFLVPRLRPGASGTFEDNDVVLVGLNHKLGQRGTVNTLLNFGERGACRGYLLGQPNRGLEHMFQMMNEARIAVGHAAVATGLAGFLYSHAYACERRQGRHPGQKDSLSPQLPIIAHADVSRLLLAQKASVEGGLALVLHCAALADRRMLAEDVATRRELELLLDLLTPVAKSWPAEYCLEANKHAIQVLGGYGYTRDHPVERLYRDNRLNMIHEGTHAIQAMDLLGRKIPQQGGAAVQLLATEIARDLAGARGMAEMAPLAADLARAWKGVEATIDIVGSCADMRRRLANASIFLDAFGHVVIAWMWLKQARATFVGQSGSGDASFQAGKMKAAQYFFRYELPAIYPKLALVGALDKTCLKIDPGEFV